MSTSSHARLAAYDSWAATRDRSARTLPAREGLEVKWLTEARERLGPEATEKEVADSASAARSAHYVRMARARWNRRAPKTGGEAA